MQHYQLAEELVGTINTRKETDKQLTRVNSAREEQIADPKVIRNSKIIHERSVTLDVCCRDGFAS